MITDRENRLEKDFGKTNLTTPSRPDQYETEYKKPKQRKKHSKNQVINLTQKQLQNSRKRLQQLRNWRIGLAKTLDLPPGLLWPATSLQRLARQPDCFDEEHFSEEVRTWQHFEFGSSLRKVINSFSSVT